MTDKEFLVKYLGRYQKLLAKIAELERYRQWIESNAVSIAGVDTTADKVQSNKRSDNVSAPVVSAVAVGEQIAELQSRATALLKNTVRIIDMLPFEARGGMVLEIHFVYGCPLATACSIIDVSRSQIYILYNQALEQLLKLREVRETLDRYAERLRESKRRRLERESSGEPSQK